MTKIDNLELEILKAEIRGVMDSNRKLLEYTKMQSIATANSDKRLYYEGMEYALSLCITDRWD